jgi:hypothetical protein
MIGGGRDVDGACLDQQSDRGQRKAIDGQDSRFDPGQQPHNATPRWARSGANSDQRQYSGDHLQDYCSPYREYDAGIVSMPVLLECVPDGVQQRGPPRAQ